jgi:DNA gyrase/topoisomerase IV subunit B
MPRRLRETTTRPTGRCCDRGDATEADHTFDMLMGEAVDPRKRYHHPRQACIDI